MPKGDGVHYAGAIVIAGLFVALAIVTQPELLDVSDGQGQENCPYKTYHVSSNSEGGFEFRIERDNEACKDHQKAGTNSEDGAHEPRTVAEADLLAQKKMAHWTLWIGVFTAFGLAVLYTTFDATKQAVVETRKIGEAQTRGYLVLQPKWVSFDGDNVIWLACELNAIGNTPLTNVTITRHYSFTGDQGEEILGNPGVLGVSSERGHTLAPEQDPILDVEGLHCHRLIERLTGARGRFPIVTVSVDVYVAWLDVFRREHEVRYAVETWFMASEPHSDIGPRISRIYPEKTYDKPRYEKWEARQRRWERQRQEQAGLIPKVTIRSRATRMLNRFRGWLADLRHYLRRK